MDSHNSNEKFIDKKTIFILKLLARIKIIEEINKQDSDAYKDKLNTELSQIVVANRLFEQKKYRIQDILENLKQGDKFDFNALINTFNLDESKKKSILDKIKRIQDSENNENNENT